MDIKIGADFDCGNIQVLSVKGGVAELAIRPDANGPWWQWFYFLVSGEAGQALTLRIMNAGGSAYPDGWPGYRACVKEDGEDWPRAPTTYADGVLQIDYTLRTTAAWFAYFAPYNQARHRTLLTQAERLGARVRKLGWSVQGRPVECITVGQGPLHVWIVSRQHSGESMASWWVEGAAERLLRRPSDPVVARLLERATVHIVPIVNVDGVAGGHLRGNAAGLDLNRQWHGPDPKTAPEVACILAAMDETGVALSLDVHGDETLPHVFVDGSDADPNSTPKQNAGVAAFKAALSAASPAFQTVVGYPVTYGGPEAPGMCTRAVAARYGAVGLTLEMPFKDSLEAPDPILGWSPNASKQLARDCITALEAILDQLS